MPKKSRFSLSDALLPLLTAEQRHLHDELRTLANEHVAHRAGDGEGALVFALLAPEPQERAIVALGSMSLQFMGPTQDFAERAIELCEFATSVLQTGINERSDALLENLRQTSDIDSLYASSQLPATSPTKE